MEKFLHQVQKMFSKESSESIVSNLVGKEFVKIVDIHGITNITMTAEVQEVFESFGTTMVTVKFTFNKATSMPIYIKTMPYRELKHIILDTVQF